MNNRLCGLFAAVLFLGVSARGQAILNFSGGNGTPFTLTLTRSVAYTVTSSTPTLNGPYFVFQNVGNILAGSFSGGSSTLTYSINGGANQTLSAIGNNLTGSVNDLTIVGTQTGAALGDIVRLNAGTFTTSGNVAGSSPASGPFNTYVLDNNGVQRSGFGVAVVPEPRAAEFLVTGGIGLLLLKRSTRRLKPAAV